MTFNEILRDLSVSAGAAGAIIIDWEGEVVASWAGSPEIDINLIGAHHEIILDIIKDASSRHGAEAVRHVAITTDKARLAMASIKEGYCLVMALGRDVPVGKALLASGRAVERIESEMG